MTPAQSYKRSVNVLKPSKARMAAIHKEFAEECEKAEKFIDDMPQTGVSLQEFYASWEEKKALYSAESWSKRVGGLLVGRLRKTYSGRKYA